MHASRVFTGVKLFYVKASTIRTTYCCVPVVDNNYMSPLLPLQIAAAAAAAAACRGYSHIPAVQQ